MLVLASKNCYFKVATQAIYPLTEKLISDQRLWLKKLLLHSLTYYHQANENGLTILLYFSSEQQKLKNMIFQTNHGYYFYYFILLAAKIYLKSKE